MTARRRETWSRSLPSVAAFAVLMKSHYRGLNNAIPAKRLALIVAVTDPDPGRVFRELVYQANLDGYPIAAVPSAATGERGGGGYAWLNGEQDLQRCVHNLRARIRGIERRIQALVDAFTFGPRQPSLLRSGPTGAPEHRGSEPERWAARVRRRPRSHDAAGLPAGQPEMP